MIPITFASSFGWYHSADGDCGIVICAAQGHEDLCTHRSLRLIADTFAARGYPAVRFDYAGTGDSLGNDSEPDRLEAWLRSIEAAVNWLRTNTGAEKIVLAGLRLGGALAALAACRLRTISGLILLAPAISGRAYMRELSTFSKLSRKPNDSETVSKAADLEIAGFLFTAETVRDIGAINLTAFKKAPAQHVLVFSTETQHGSTDRLTQAWSELGCHIERHVFSHYAEFMMDPAFSRFPEEAIQKATNWLGRHFEITQMAPKAARKTQLLYKPHEEKHFIEYPVFFDARRDLFGMMCVPDDLDCTRPTVIYVNAGANHHIGWGRTTVEVCRKLAEHGLASLRIDIGAIGDSQDPDPKPEQVLYREASQLDVSAAIDWLKSEGFHNITIIGLCAGAHLGFHSAVSDPRISQVVMVNLQVFLWHETDSLAVVYREAYQSIGFYLRRIFALQTWQKFVRGDVKGFGIARAVSLRLRKKAVAAVAPIGGLFGTQACDETSLVKSWMKTLDERQVKQHYIFSVGDAGLDELSLYRRIRRGRIKGAPCTFLWFIDNADHNFSQHLARARLADILKITLRGEKEKDADSISRPASSTLAIPTHHI